MHKFQYFAAKVNHRGEVRIPQVYRKAICKELGIEDLKGCILELKITVIHLKDNNRIDFD